MRLAVTCALVTVASALECKPSVKGGRGIDLLSAKPLLPRRHLATQIKKKELQLRFQPCGVATVASTCKSSDHCPLDGTVNTAAVIQMDGTEAVLLGRPLLQA